MARLRSVTIAVAVALAVSAPASASASTAQAGAPQGFRGLEPSQLAALNEYTLAHPLDLVGQASLVKSFIGVDLRYSASGPGANSRGNLSAAEAQRMMAHSNKGVSGPTTNDLKPDTFSVTVTLIPVQGPPPSWIVRGQWDFRDDFVGTGAPDDFMSPAFSAPGCSGVHITHLLAIPWDVNGGMHIDADYLQDSGLTTLAPIDGLHDRTSAFMTNIDHGFYDATFGLFGCGSDFTGVVGGAFSYEHNQGGGSVVSISASFAGLSISYNGGPLSLRKSTPPVYSS
jgi:hypothetical protein